MLFYSLEENRLDYEDDVLYEALYLLSLNSKGCPELELKPLFLNCFVFFFFYIVPGQNPTSKKKPLLNLGGGI